jgi:predicted polyphosphate/ATP-dependent NAD kinase
MLRSRRGRSQNWSAVQAPSKTEAARLAAALLDQFGTVKLGKLEILDIDAAARVLERASRRARLCVDAWKSHVISWSYVAIPRLGYRWG